MTFRADSAFYSKSFVTACHDHEGRFPVTVKTGITVHRRAIATIRDDAWVPIPYWPNDRADVAETTYTAFNNTKDGVELRLIVRRVRPTPESQLALDVVFDYHAILTDRDRDMLELEADYRAHAVVELAIRDLRAGGLAHVPSGMFTANAAWLALTVLAHNLERRTMTATGDTWSKATAETLRPKLVSMPARLAHSGRRLRLLAPTNWHWSDPFETALVRIADIPAPT